MALTLLLGMTALAVDLGWLYLNGSRVQRAADAAALAAVVHLPHNLTGVNGNVVDAANANGWAVGTLNGGPAPGSSGPDSATWRQLSDNRLEVTLTTTVPTFFARILGIDEVTITRRATAEYIKPVPLGSPFSCFGEAPGIAECPDGNFWAAIQMPYTAKHNGDPFLSRCILANANNPPGACNGDNPEYDSGPQAYYYAIEVPDVAGVASLNVQVYDATFHRRPVGSNNCSGFPETGDCDYLEDTNRVSTGYSGTATQNTHFELLAPDETPLDPTNNPSTGCSVTVGRNNDTYRNQWRTLCSVSAGPGIYVLKIWTSGNSGGSNHYSVRATTNLGSARPKVYGINYVSVFTNQSATTMNMYLAEIVNAHAGKTLVLELYDIGEDDSAAWMRFSMPNGTMPPCEWTARDEAGSVVESGSLTQCNIQTSAASGAMHRRFNAEWLEIRIQIPSTYSCTTDCWWRAEVDNNQPHDRTTWGARVIGNPVRLVPNEPTAP